MPFRVADVLEGTEEVADHGCDRGGKNDGDDAALDVVANDHFHVTEDGAQLRAMAAFVGTKSLPAKGWAADKDRTIYHEPSFRAW